MATAAHTLRPLPQLSPAVSDWVNSVRELTQPRAIHWCEGTETEAREITSQLVARGEFTALNAEQFPGCYLYRSAPNDVARVEHLTYICTRSQQDAGPNNHWMDPQQAHARLRELFSGCMRERNVGKRVSGEGTTRKKRASPGGSSNVFKSAFCASAGIIGATITNTRPPSPIERNAARSRNTRASSIEKL